MQGKLDAAVAKASKHISQQAAVDLRTKTKEPVKDQRTKANLAAQKIVVTDMNQALVESGSELMVNVEGGKLQVASKELANANSFSKLKAKDAWDLAKRKNADLKQRVDALQKMLDGANTQIFDALDMAYKQPPKNKTVAPEVLVNTGNPPPLPPKGPPALPPRDYANIIGQNPAPLPGVQIEADPAQAGSEKPQPIIIDKKAEKVVKATDSALRDLVNELRDIGSQEDMGQRQRNHKIREAKNHLKERVAKIFSEQLEGTGMVMKFSEDNFSIVPSSKIESVMEMDRGMGAELLGQATISQLEGQWREASSELNDKLDGLVDEVLSEINDPEKRGRLDSAIKRRLEASLVSALLPLGICFETGVLGTITELARQNIISLPGHPGGAIPTAIPVVLLVIAAICAIATPVTGVVLNNVQKDYEAGKFLAESGRESAKTSLGLDLFPDKPKPQAGELAQAAGQAAPAVPDVKLERLQKIGGELEATLIKAQSVVQERSQSQGRGV